LALDVVGTGCDGSGILRPQAHAIAHAEVRGIVQRDLLIIPVAVELQRRRGRLL
jgi:hypothetical protein